MQTKKKILMPPREDTVVDKVICDICKVEAVKPNSTEAPFTNEPCTIDNVTIEAAHGSAYPSGGDKTTTVFDICPTCFRDKVVPALAAMGAKPRTENTDW